MSQSIKIYALQFSTFARCVQLLCEEKNLSYEIVTEYQGNAIELGNPTLKNLHPFGKIPAIEVDGKLLFETGPILRFLNSRFDGPNLEAENLLENAVVDQWTEFAASYIDKAIVRDVLLEFFFPRGENGAVREEVVKANLPALQYALEVVSKQLGANNYVCGDKYTLADIMLTPQLDYLAKSPLAGDFIPEGSVLSAYLERLRARESAKVVLV